MIARWYRRESGRRHGQNGSITAIQRFGSALNLNLHVIHLDGVYDRGADRDLRFFHVPPRTKEIERLVEQIGTKFERWLARQGFGNEAEDAPPDSGDDADDADSGATGQTVWYRDGDGDGLGTAANAIEACDGSVVYVDNWKDCDDDRVDGEESACVDYATVWGSEMIMIPSGTFEMGGGAGDPDGSYIDHSVTLTHDFWIGQTELTQGEWALFTAATDTTPSNFSTCGSDCPVERVSWYDAAKYCNALSTAEGLTPCYDTTSTPDLAAAYLTDPYSCPGYRLPTEAEWEYAARAGVDTAYSGSNTAALVAWTDVYDFRTTYSVCGLAANAWGLCDMSGNVAEWVNDWYGTTDGYVDGLPHTNPTGPFTGSNRVLRGGGWKDVALTATVSCRYGIYPEYNDNWVGLRLARSMP